VITTRQWALATYRFRTPLQRGEFSVRGYSPGLIQQARSKITVVFQLNSSCRAGLMDEKSVRESRGGSTAAQRRVLFDAEKRMGVPLKNSLEIC
jgi:hypothetical protein